MKDFSFLTTIFLALCSMSPFTHSEREISSFSLWQCMQQSDPKATAYSIQPIWPPLSTTQSVFGLSREHLRGGSPPLSDSARCQTARADEGAPNAQHTCRAEAAARALDVVRRIIMRSGWAAVGALPLTTAHPHNPLALCNSLARKFPGPTTLHAVSCAPRLST